MTTDMLGPERETSSPTAAAAALEELSDSRRLDAAAEIEVKRDMWGYDVHTRSDSCISLLNKYYLQVLTYGQYKRVILEAADADRSCALACALAANYLWSPQRSKVLSPEVIVYMSAAKANLETSSTYERLVVTALVAMMERDDEDILALHFEILETYPKDLVSLKRAQTLCFNKGWSKSMLRLAFQALPANLERPYMFGMLAFAYVEVGSNTEGETAARVALAIESQDVWAQHALCHALDYQCRFKEALSFMYDNCKLWETCCSFVYGHNWWHIAVCHLELGGSSALSKVLAAYDYCVWGMPHGKKNPQHSTIVEDSQKLDGQKYINALGLLLRLDIRGHQNVVDHRVSQVTTCLKESGILYQELQLDLLSVWGLARVNQLEEAAEILTSIRCRSLAPDGHKQAVFQYVVPLAAALYDYARGDYQGVCRALGSTFNIDRLKVIGASKEQLDVFEEMWCVASIRAGQPKQVIQVVKQLNDERSEIPFKWRILEEAYLKGGKVVKANHAAAKARLLEVAADSP